MGNSDLDNFNTLKTAYNACMAVDKIKQVGLKPLQDELKAFPVLKDTKDLSGPILYLEKLGISSLLNLSPNPDDKDPVSARDRHDPIFFPKSLRTL